MPTHLALSARVARGTSLASGTQRKILRHVGGGSDGRSYRIASGSRSAPAFDEKTFWYFLAIERKRSERSGRPALLLQVDLQGQPGDGARISSPIASKLFSGMWRCLRETDFIGWYRAEHVAGALLADVWDGPGMEVPRSIEHRVAGVLRGRLPTDLARRLQVRALSYPAPAGIDTGGSRVAAMISGDLSCSS